MSENVNYHTKKHCKSCKAIFQSSILDDTIYCENCREDEDHSDEYSSSRYWDDICNTNLLGEGSSRTSPVFYD